MKDKDKYMVAEIRTAAATLYRIGNKLHKLNKDKWPEKGLEMIGASSIASQWADAMEKEYADTNNNDDGSKHILRRDTKGE